MDSSYEIREILLVVIDDLCNKLSGIGIRLQTKIRDVVGLQQKEKTVVIPLKKVLEKYPVDVDQFVSKQNDIENSIGTQRKLAVFRKAVEFSLWEIDSKLTLMKKFISQIDQMDDLYQIGSIISECKKIIMEMISVEQIYVTKTEHAAEILTSSQIRNELANISDEKKNYRSSKRSKR